MNDDLLKRTEGGNYFDELLTHAGPSPQSLPSRKQIKSTISSRNERNTSFHP